jgi:exodeoxyribonuclease III
VRIATWNVNSVKQRKPRLLGWLEERQPDVVCLQETKLSDAAFASEVGTELAERGYAVAHHGQGGFNGVALLSRVGLGDVVVGIDGAPGYPDAAGEQEARSLAATCGGVRVHSLYVPNGREPDSDHYRYKLVWLDALRAVIDAGPDDVVVCGDMNIAPADADVFDPKAFAGHTHVTARGHVPPGPRDAHRPGARRTTRRGASAGRLGRPAGPQGNRPERPRPGHGRPG